MAGKNQRRPWDSLSHTYRRRLERSGVSQSQYESGVPLTVARGHAKTPERPGRQDLRADYAAYRAKRTQPMRVITPEGMQVLSGMTTADRSTVGRHLAAVRWYLQYGTSRSRLPDFDDVTVTGYSPADKYVSPVTVPLDTDPGSISAKARNGELDFDSPYPQGA